MFEIAGSGLDFTLDELGVREQEFLTGISAMAGWENPKTNQDRKILLEVLDRKDSTSLVVRYIMMAKIELKVGGLDFAPDELGIADDDQDFDTEITLPKPPAIIKDEVFQRVAAIAGWIDVRLWFNDPNRDTYIGTKVDSSKGIFIPRYDRSIDAIWELFEEFGLYPCITRMTYEGEIHCHVSAFSDPLKSDISVCEIADDPNPAIALCKLLIAISEKIE